MFDLQDIKLKMASALDHFSGELAKIRTGRANPGMLGGVKVSVYGTQLPLNQTATITAPEASMILVTPFDPSNIAAISAGIRTDQTLGLNPSDDGRVIRVPIPPLTEERRRQIVKQTAEKVEESKITLRNIRQDAFKDIKQLQEVGDDEKRRFEKQIDDLMREFQSNIDTAFKDKEAEIMKV
ncbi:ribosome recycling factor [Candidatus Saccharibacteria bacterium]|nr:ribosome recycling factor [Candidatus Saccharibacteria bacterium]